MERRAAAFVLHVDVGALERERLRGFELLPAPAGEEGRFAGGNVNLGAAIDQHVENVDVFPPAGGIETIRPGAAFQQPLHYRGIAAFGGGKPDRRAEVWTRAAFLFDVETTVQQVLDHASAGGFRLPQLLAIGAAREVKEIAALIVPDLQQLGLRLENAFRLFEVEGLDRFDQARLRHRSLREMW